jgi:hypothetical protein
VVGAGICDCPTSESRIHVGESTFGLIAQRSGESTPLGLIAYGPLSGEAKYPAGARPSKCYYYYYYTTKWRIH